MIKSILAYLIAFVMAPLLSGFAGLIILPILFISARLVDEERLPRGWTLYVDLLGFVVFMFMGLLSAYVGSIIFSMFGKEPTILMLIMLGVGITINDFRRIRRITTPGLRSSETLRYIGSLVGLTVGGFCVL